MLSYKIFVRQSENNPEVIINKHKGELSFRGDEARKAYEDIIIETNSKTLEQASNTCQSLAPKSHIFQGKKHEKFSETRKTKISANVILKSIEQADWNFIKENITKDNVNIIDDFGWTPLMLAAYCGNTEIVEYLLSLGADKNLKEKSGLDALQLARKKHYNHIISLLKCDKKLIKTSRKEKSQQSEEKLCEFYCLICKRNFRETTVRKHETSMLHIFNTNPKLPDPVYGISKGNKGYQMMLNGGWEESRGLGPSGSGLKYPVKTILKRDRKGLGGEGDRRARVTHFKSGDSNAIRHVRHNRVMEEKSYKRKDREKFLSREARRDRALRRALS